MTQRFALVSRRLATAGLVAASVGCLASYDSGKISCGPGTDGTCPDGWICSEGLCYQGGASGTGGAGATTGRASGGASTSGVSSAGTSGTAGEGTSTGGSTSTGAVTSAGGSTATATSSGGATSGGTTGGASSGASTTTTGGSSSGGGTGSSGGTSGAQAFVQFSQSVLNGGGDYSQIETPAFSSPVANGDLLLVAVGYNNATEAITVSDVLGNAFTQLDDQFNGSDGSGLRTFFAAGVAGGADEAVVAFFTPSTIAPAIYAAEYAGLDTIVAHEMVQQSAVPASPDAASVALTSGDAGTLIWAFSDVATALGQMPYAAGTGFAPRDPDGGSWNDGSGAYGCAEDRPAFPGSVQTATWTLSNPTDLINTLVLLR